MAPLPGVQVGSKLPACAPVAYSRRRRHVLQYLWKPVMRNSDKHILAPCLGESLAKLEAFARLEENWDSYDARPISQAAFEQAGELLNRVQADWLATWGDSIAPYFLCAQFLYYRAVGEKVKQKGDCPRESPSRDCPFLAKFGEIRDAFLQGRKTRDRPVSLGVRPRRIKLARLCQSRFACPQLAPKEPKHR
jgi:hypothetical protein